MVRLVKCDKCGAISEGDIEYYSLNRYGEDVNEEAVSQRGSQMTETEEESFKGRIPSLG